MRENKLKKIFKEGKVVVNGWLQIPSSFSAEVMANQGWDSLTIDMQHGAIDYPNALQMLQAISTTDVVPMARVNWNEPGQIMKILDAGSYGVICPMVSNRQQAEKFVQACMYPPKGYRSFGPLRGLIYGGSDYGKHANNEILKLAMIETKEALDNLDNIMSTPGVDGIYIGPADLSLAVGEEPGFDKKENDPVFAVIMKILEHAKNIFKTMFKIFSENIKNASKMSQNHSKILQKTPRETPFPLRNQNPFQKKSLGAVGETCISPNPSSANRV